VNGEGLARDGVPPILVAPELDVGLAAFDDDIDLLSGATKA
jgi:hypothetical protein